MLRNLLVLTKGIIRDPRTRRNVMFWLIMAALIMLFLGSWLLSDRWARANPWLYMGYWLLCAWLTIAGMLLALFDILLIRAAQRAARRALEKQLIDEHLDEDGDR